MSPCMPRTDLVSFCSMPEVCLEEVVHKQTE